MFITAHQLSLFRARCIHYVPLHPVSLRLVLILSTHPRLDLPSGLFPYQTCLCVRPIPRRLIITGKIVEQHKPWSCLLRSFLQSPVTSSLIPQILEHPRPVFAPFQRNTKLLNPACCWDVLWRDVTWRDVTWRDVFPVAQLSKWRISMRNAETEGLAAEDWHSVSLGS